MVLDLTFFLFAIPAVLFAGISKGGFGSTAAFASAPFLALAIDPGLAIGLMLPLLIVMDFTTLGPFWGRWSRRDARALMIGVVPGIGAGILLFHIADGDMLRLMIGCIAIAFVAFQLAQHFSLIQVAQRPFQFWRAAGWGILSGFTTFISHAGGPPSAVHLLGQRLSKEAFQATTVVVFWWANLLKIGPYIALGLVTAETAWANVLLAPVAVIGAVLGVYAHRWISEKLFFQITYTLLSLTGLKLILDGLF